MGVSSAKRRARAGVAARDTAALAALGNLGPRSAEMLAAAGIESVEQLRELGAVEAYARVRGVWKGASLNLLWALEGALSGEHWRVVARERRASLLLALDARDAGAAPPPSRRRHPPLT